MTTTVLPRPRRPGCLEGHLLMIALVQHSHPPWGEKHTRSAHLVPGTIAGNPASAKNNPRTTEGYRRRGWEPLFARQAPRKYSRFTFPTAQNPVIKTPFQDKPEEESLIMPRPTSNRNRSHQHGRRSANARRSSETNLRQPEGSSPIRRSKGHHFHPYHAGRTG